MSDQYMNIAGLQRKLEKAETILQEALDLATKHRLERDELEAWKARYENENMDLKLKLKQAEAERDELSERLSAEINRRETLHKQFQAQEIRLEEAEAEIDLIWQYVQEKHTARRCCYQKWKAQKEGK